MKRILSLLFLFVSAVLLISCGKAVPIEDFKIEGNATEVLNGKEIASLQSMTLPENLKLSIRIDSLCPSNDYLNEVDGPDSAIVVQVYLQPRLIKADVWQASHYLKRIYGKDYFNIQNTLADDGDIPAALQKMVRLCSSAYVNSHLDGKRNIFGDITSGIDDFVDMLASILEPRDNFWGKITSPCYKAIAWCIAESGSVAGGILLLTLIFSCISTVILVLFSSLFGINLEVSRYTLLFIIILTSWMYVGAAVTFYYKMSAPSIEIIYLLRDICGSLADLESVYSEYLFKSPSVTFFLITFFVVMIVSVWVDISAKENMPSENAEDDEPKGLAVFFGGVFGAVSVGYFMVPYNVSNEFLLTMLCFAGFILLQKLIVSKIPYLGIKRILILAVLYWLGYIGLSGQALHPQTKEMQRDNASYAAGVIAGDLTANPDAVYYIHRRSFIRGYKEYNKKRLYVMSDNELDYPFDCTKNYADVALLQSDMKQYSYLSGAKCAKTMYEMGIMDDIDHHKFLIGLRDNLVLGNPKFSQEEIKNILDEYIEDNVGEISSRNCEVASDFFEKNYERPGVEVLTYFSKAQYYIVSKGDDSKKPKKTSSVTIEYTCHKLNGDKVLSENAVKRVSALLPEIGQALSLIGAGGEIQLYLAHEVYMEDKELARLTEPGELLVFNVKLLKVR